MSNEKAWIIERIILLFFIVLCMAGAWIQKPGSVQAVILTCFTIYLVIRLLFDKYYG